MVRYSSSINNKIGKHSEGFVPDGFTKAAVSPLIIKGFFVT